MTHSDRTAPSRTFFARQPSPYVATLALIAFLSGCVPIEPSGRSDEPAAARFESPVTSNDRVVARTENFYGDDDAPVSLPFELRDNLVTMPVVVNGKTITGVLDSGSGSILMDRRVSREIALIEQGEAGEALGGGTEAKTLSNITIGDFRFGPVHLEDAPGYAIDLGHLTSSAGFPVDLVVGAPVLEKGAVRVDYRTSTITFAHSGSFDGCAFPIAFELVHNVPVVNIKLGTTQDAAPVDLKVMVDLGSRGGALNLGGPFLRTSTGQAFLAAGKSQKVGHGVGGAVQGTVAQAAELRIGELVFDDLRTQLTSQIPAFEAGLFDGTLGVPLWNTGTISFDYPARQICIELGTANPS